MDIRTKCLIFFGLIIVVLVAMYSLFIKAPQPKETYPPGTQIEYSEKIEVEGGYEKRWSFGGPLPSKKTELKDKK